MIIDDYCFFKDNTIIESLIHMEKNHLKYLILINEEKIVVAVLTDGDIRRGLINKYSLDSKVIDIANRNFVKISETESLKIVLKLFYDTKIDFIPILDNDNKLINILTRKILNALLLNSDDFSLQYDFEVYNEIIIEHEIFDRPWGYYKTTVLNENFQSKVIYVRPKQALSLQSHKFREEYWVIIKGKGEVIVGDESRIVLPGDYVHIPCNTKHRIMNTKNETLIFNEIQLGNYFGEDDIIRYEDNYNRK